jgi:hypothetical protein
MSSESAADFKRKFESKSTGRERGGTVVLDAPYDITFPGVTPENMALDTIGDRAEERIPAALLLNAVALQLGAGLDHSAYNNMDAAIKSAFDNGIAPLHTIVADTASRKLAPEFGSDSAKLRIWFDYSTIPALQEDQNALHTRVREDYKAGIIDLWTANTELGRPVTDDMKGVYAKQGPDMSAFKDAMSEVRAMAGAPRMRLPELRALPKSSALAAYDVEVVLDAIEGAEQETRALMLAKVEGAKDE